MKNGAGNILDFKQAEVKGTPRPSVWLAYMNMQGWAVITLINIALFVFLGGWASLAAAVFCWCVMWKWVRYISWAEHLFEMIVRSASKDARNTKEAYGPNHPLQAMIKQWKRIDPTNIIKQRREAAGEPIWWL